jgi:hypothetical protein
MKNIVAFLLVFSSLFASSQTQFLGAPNTTVVARGNMKVDSILYLPKREKTPTDTGALRYQISDSSLYVWTGNAWRKAKNDGTITSVSAGTGMSFATITSTGSVSADTNVLATKSWRQKGDDSLGAIIATKGTGTVTSVGTGYGIDGGTITTTGTLTADTLNLATRLRLQKVGDSLGLLISNAGGGTVTGVSAGTGMSFTTITSSGAVNADTLVLSTRSWRQKGDDSLGAIIATKVNISDTATMLSPYAKTSALGLYLPLTGGTLTGGLTGTTAAFTSSGGDNTFDITHSSGSGIALNISKGGNGEGLYVNKTSGTGNAATIIGTLNATTLVKSGGTSTQYLMADGTTSTLTNPVTGTGTTNRSVKFTGTSTVGNGSIADSASVLSMVLKNNEFTYTGNVNISGNFSYILNEISGVASQQLRFRNTGVNKWQNYLNTSDNSLRWFNSTNAADRLTILESGDVGIATGSPAYKLDVAGTLRNTTGAAFATSSGNVLVGTTVDGGSYKLDVQGALRNTTGAAFATASGNVGIGTASPSTGFKLEVEGSLFNRFNAALAFNDTAKVGIGISVPSDKLHVVGTGRFTGVINAGSTSSVGIQMAAGTAIRTTGDIYHDFGTGGTGTFNVRGGSGFGNYITVLNAGNVGMNTTAPTERLDVNGRARVRTIDSTSTAMNMLYADATGVIKKAAVPSGGSGTVTSVATGFGLSGGTITTTGTLIVDSASVATRARVQKGIDSVSSIAVKGTGISGYFPKWTGTGTQDTSQLFQLGRNIGIGTASPTFRLHLPDAGSTANQAMIAGTIFGSDGNGITISPNSSNITIKGGQGNGSIYSGTISSVARWGINTTSISDAVLSIDGDVKIVTVDSTSTARNMLYQDANGMIKKSAVPSGGVSGSGTTSYLPKWTSGKGLGNSSAYDNGGEILISTTEDAGDYKLQVAGAIYTTSTITTGGVNGESVKPWKLGSRKAATVALDATQYIEVEVNGVLYNIALVTIL